MDYDNLNAPLYDDEDRRPLALVVGDLRCLNLLTRLGCSVIGLRLPRSTPEVLPAAHLLGAVGPRRPFGQVLWSTMKRKVEWRIGDVFLIPIGDGTHVTAQIIGREPSVLNSASIALFDAHVAPNDPPNAVPDNECVFATLFVTRDLLDRGVWPVAGNHPVRVPLTCLPYEDRRSTGFIGAKVIGSGIVQHFVAAYYGVEPWDQYKDPHYFDKLLLAPDKKPARIRLKRDEQNN